MEEMTQREVWEEHKQRHFHKISHPSVLFFCFLGLWAMTKPTLQCTIILNTAILSLFAPLTHPHTGEKVCVGFECVFLRVPGSCTWNYPPCLFCSVCSALPNPFSSPTDPLILSILLGQFHFDNMRNKTEMQMSLMKVSHQHGPWTPSGDEKQFMICQLPLHGECLITLKNPC